MRLRIPLLVTVAILGALSGCSASRPHPSPSPSAAAGFGDRAFPSAAPVNVRAVDEAIFRTPSKNIGCTLSATSVRCDIGRRDWASPSKPADCDLDYGNGLYLEKDKKAGFTCAGDSLLGATTEVLQYGYALRAGDFTCDSESVAVRCTNQRNGHGFTLSVQNYVLF
jgi:hypothetical protein